MYTCSRDQAELDTVLEPLKAKGFPVAGCMADVTETDAAEHLVNQALAFFGGVSQITAQHQGVRCTGTAFQISFTGLTLASLRSLLLPDTCQMQLDIGNCFAHLAPSPGHQAGTA